MKVISSKGNIPTTLRNAAHIGHPKSSSHPCNPPQEAFLAITATFN